MIEIFKSLGEIPTTSKSFYSDVMQNYLDSLKHFEDINCYDYYIIKILYNLGATQLKPLVDFMFEYLSINKKVFQNFDNTLEVFTPGLLSNTDFPIVDNYVNYYNFLSQNYITNQVKIDHVVIGLLQNSLVTLDFKELNNYLCKTYTDIMICNGEHINILKILSSEKSIKSTNNGDNEFDYFTHRKYFRTSGIFSLNKYTAMDDYSKYYTNSVLLLNFYNNILMDILEIVEYIQSINHLDKFDVSEVYSSYGIHIIGDSVFGDNEDNMISAYIHTIIDKCM